MMPWQHAHLIVTYEGEHTEETGLIFKKQHQIEDWAVYWAGPEDVWQTVRSGRSGTPMHILNELGAEGWQVVAAFHDAPRFEYVLKREVVSPTGT